MDGIAELPVVCTINMYIFILLDVALYDDLQRVDGKICIDLSNPP